MRFSGELICFFRAPPRIVRNVLRAITGAAPKEPEETAAAQAQPPPPPPPPPLEQPPPPPQPPQQTTSYFQSPALVSDAVRRLGLAATDRIVQPIDPRRPAAELNILRAMTNLLTMPQHQQQRQDLDSKHPDDAPKAYPLVASRRSIVFLTTTRDFAGADQKVAVDYIFTAKSLAVVCETNAKAARSHGRYDHERIFNTLTTLFKRRDKDKKDRGSRFASDMVAAQVIKRM